MLETADAPMKTKVLAHEELSDVYQTSNLDAFKEIKGRRPINSIHVKNLIKSMEEFGYLCRPLLVNEKLEVVDGNHRLEAAKFLGIAIYFVVVPGTGLKELHVMGLNQKNWSQQSFLESYANLGYVDYVKLRAFHKENPEFKLNDVILMCTNPYSHNPKEEPISRRNFKKGKWKLMELNRAEGYIKKLNIVKKHYEGYRRSSFIGTMIDLLNHPDFDFELFIKKLKLQPTAMIDCSKKTQYRRVIEDIYNYKNHNKVNLMV